MPTNFPGVFTNGFPDVIAPNNADVGDTFYLLQMAQSVADRTRYLLQALNGIAPHGAVDHLRTFAADADLLAFAVTYTGSGDLALVLNQGLYVYDESDLEDPSLPLVRAPTSVGSGSGRWRLIARYAQPEKGLIGTYVARNDAAHSMLSGDADLSLNSIVTAPLKENDVLVVTGTFTVNVFSGFAQGAQKLLVNGAPYATATFSGDTFLIGGSPVARTFQSVAASWLSVPVDDEGYTYTLSHTAHCGGGGFNMGGEPQVLTVLHYRP